MNNNNLPDNPNIEVIKAKETGLFTNYIFKAIPLAFDESMSYYETLCGLLNYLKNTILPTLNNNVDAVAELQSLYEELKTYVDNYFTNLDVQEEINNKLDEMVEDGTLNNILSSYLYKIVDCFDDLFNTILFNNQKIMTLGFHQKNDGGKATYLISNVENENYFQIPLNNGLYANLIIENNNINILQCGCVNDGITDNSSLFEKIINYSVFNKKSIYIPSGSYYGNFEVNLNKIYNNSVSYNDSILNIDIYGDGEKSRLISRTGTIFSLIGSSKNELGNSTNERTIKWCNLRDFVLDGISSNNGNIGLNIEIAQNINIDNIHITNVTQNFIFKSAMDLNITQCNFMNSGAILNDEFYYPMIINKNDEVTISSNAIKFVNCRFEHMHAFVDIHNAYSIFFTNCKFETGVINNSNNSPLNFQACKDVFYNNCHFQYSNGYSSANSLTSVSDNYFIKTSNYNGNQNSGNKINFINCDFNTNPNFIAKWFTGHRTDFNNCFFGGCNTNEASYPFHFNNNCHLINNTFITAISPLLFWINGNNNILDDCNIIIYGENFNYSPAIIYFYENSNFNKCNFNIPDSLLQNRNTLVSAHSSFTNNNITNLLNNIVELSNHSHFINSERYNLNLPLIYNFTHNVNSLRSINFIRDGLVVNILFATSGEIYTSQNLRTKSGENKSYSSGDTIQFLFINGIGYEL